MDNNLPGLPPAPVSMLRLVAVAKRMDLTYSFSNIDSAEPRFIITHDTGAQTTIQLETFPRERGVFTVNLPGSVDFDRLPELTHFVNEWNHDCISPTLVVNVSTVDTITVWGRTTLETSAGLSDPQLAEGFANALNNTSVLIDEITEHFPELLAPDTSVAASVFNAGPAYREDSTIESIATHPREVTIDRIRGALSAMGVVRVTEIPEMGISTRINGMAFMFLLDNGPTLVAKGSWDTNLDATDFTRMFLVCNDYNRDSHLVSAFCHSNDDGLQIRMDASVPIGEGLNDEQFTIIIASTVQELLTGADHLAHQSGGVSPVSWPETD